MNVEPWSQEPSPIYQVYASGGALSGDADLVADGGGPCRTILVGTAGSLVLVREDGTQITVPAEIATAGSSLPVRAKTIKAASTAQKIMVLW